MKKIIVTADDYGMSKAVNEAIDEGIGAGFITSTNLMTNMQCREAASDFKAKFPEVSLGLHWNLTCGYPLSPVESIPTLVEPNGKFHSYSVFRKLYRSGKIKEEDILTELRAQAKEFVRITGICPDYWNTHENVHVDFKIYFLFASIAADASKLGIDKPIMTMRSHQHIYVSPKGSDAPLSLKWKFIEPIKSKMLDSWQNKLRRQGFSAPDGRLVYMNRTDLNDIAHVVKNIRWKKEDSTAEMVFHPATAVDSEFFGKMKDNRLVEWRTVTDKKNVTAVKAEEYELVNYAGRIM